MSVGDETRDRCQREWPTCTLRYVPDHPERNTGVPNPFEYEMKDPRTNGDPTHAGLQLSVKMANKRPGSDTGQDWFLSTQAEIDATWP